LHNRNRHTDDVMSIQWHWYDSNYAINCS